MTAPRGEPEPESQPATDPTGPLPATTSGGPVSVRCQGCGHPLGTLRSTGTGRGWEADWTGARAVHGALSGTAGPACLNGRTGEYASLFVLNDPLNCAGRDVLCNDTGNRYRKQNCTK